MILCISKSINKQYDFFTRKLQEEADVELAQKNWEDDVVWELLQNQIFEEMNLLKLNLMQVLFAMLN